MNGSNDNFEDFFHQSFKDEESVNQAGDWNLPSDEVWEGIQAGMTEERKLSFVFLKWPWSAIAASYLLLMGGYQFLENKIDKNNFDVAIAVEESLINQADRVADAPYNEDFIIDEKGIQNSHFSLAITKNDLNPKLNIINRNTILESTQVIDNQISIEKEFLNRNKEEWTFSPLASLITDKITSPSITNVKINLTSVTLVLPTTTNTYVALNYSPVSEELKAQDIIYPLPLNSDQTEVATGKSVGVNVGWTNKKGWSLETGIHYTQLTKETVVNEQISTPISDTDLTLEWNDAYGDKEVDFKINRTASTPPLETTVLNMQLTQKTKSHFVDIPILVRKNWTFGKLNLSAKTGLLNRFNISNAYETPILTSEGNRFEFLATEFRQNTTIENNKYVPQLVAGIGLEYFIQPNLSVYVEPTVSRSLRPVIDFSSAAIHSKNKALTMGMRYHL